MARRLVAAIGVVALLTGLAAVLLSTAPSPAQGEAGAYPLSIRGPDGGLWWDGTVQVGERATPLLALQAAAAQGNFSVAIEPHSLGAYVVAIGPFGETATGGWNYCVDQGDGYRWVGAAADQWPLETGDRVEWRWVEDGLEICT